MVKGLAKPPAKRRGGFKLLRQIYDELYSQLGDDFAPAELLRAAQTLIEITNEEYATESSHEGHHHSGYFSFAVDYMIVEREWWLLAIEALPVDVSEDESAINREAKQRLKRLYNPDPYYHRG